VQITVAYFCDHKNKRNWQPSIDVSVMSAWQLKLESKIYCMLPLAGTGRDESKISKKIISFDDHVQHS
jgi:hypothetical protein